MSAQFLSRMLASGGDGRIAIPRGANTNLYGASPFPRSTLGYASSTANDISLDAFGHLERVVASWPPGGPDAEGYADRLDAMRQRIRTVFGLDHSIDIVFAPSGTDLEYVALALTVAKAGRPVTNILLGQDEIGSGCALSAAGRFFAAETAVAPDTPKGAPVEGLAATDIAYVPVRDRSGEPLDSADVAGRISSLARAAGTAGREVLAHVVHGSKTGLALPCLAQLGALRAEHADELSLVVDACQGRLEPADLGAYLDLGAIVLLTGSKFVGGPPFSGWALVPPSFADPACLPQGLATIFRRGEWPLRWRGCDDLPRSANPGLLLRLEAALFELERFGALPAGRRQAVIDAFGAAVRGFAERLGVPLIAPALERAALHTSTLATLDLSQLPGNPDLRVAQRWHRVLAARGLRLGQPVKCIRRPDGEWAGTLRLSLSMPLIVELAGLDGRALGARLARDMAQIAGIIEAAQRPVVA